MGRIEDRLKDLEEFALVVVNNGNTRAYAEIPDRPDLFEWLCNSYQNQVDALFADIEELQTEANSLRNRMKHDPEVSKG